MAQRTRRCREPHNVMSQCITGVQQWGSVVTLFGARWTYFCESNR
jgi:hypothetical protein